MPVEDFEKGAIKLLAGLILVTGWTRHDLDKRLGYASGYMSRLLTGETRLLYSHILSILETIEVDPLFFFTALHPRGASPAELLSAVEELKQLAASEQTEPAPLDERVRQAVETVLRQRGPAPRAPGSRRRAKKPR